MPTIDANNLPCTKQAVKTKPKQVFFFHFSLFLTIYLLFKCSYVACLLDKGDFPENLHTVCLC